MDDPSSSGVATNDREDTETLPFSDWLSRMLYDNELRLVGRPRLPDFSLDGEEVGGTTRFMSKSWDEDVKAEVILSDPRNHDIFAGGRDPDERHSISDLTPADKGRFGAIIVTSNGLTVLQTDNK